MMVRYKEELCFILSWVDFAVADILLWKNNKLSAAILAGFTIIWLLFEVAEYHFVTLLCHLLIITMLIIFIWFKAAGLTER
jgi:hypothetical protein